MQGRRERGKLIVLEGGEGCGKGTQADLLREWLRTRNHQVLPKEKAREPGGTPEGEAIRRILLHTDSMEFTPEVEALLFYAARLQLLRRVIQPGLESGTQVVLDRYFYSTEAYQGARDVNPELISSLRDLLVMPDLTFIIDIDHELGLRLATKRGVLDRIERRSLEYHARVSQIYRQLASDMNTVEHPHILLPFVYYEEDKEKGIAEMREIIRREVTSRLNL